MKIKKIEKRLDWDKLFNDSGSVSFLQSWEWGEFQTTFHHKIERIKIVENNKTLAIAQIIKQRVKRGDFLYVPHGPLIVGESNHQNQKKALEALLDYLKKIATEEKYMFIRIAPVIDNTEENATLYANLNFKKAPIFINADEHIWLLPINKNEETLLKEMRKTTRYLIRRAPKDGVTIEKRTDEGAVEDFWPIYEETTKRENFSPFSKNFIKNEFEYFYKNGKAVFLFGKAEGKYLASALVVFTESTGFYHQGASIHTKLPVPYLLQWEAIKEAKSRGCRFYNFWGVAPEDDDKHPWKGLSLFKRGFGGHQVSFLPTQDYIISPRYYLTYIYEKWLRWRRGV
jgi:lipid II:glycine glycyltransferase (peptidoglycan interpeptide bridge formation enzyme)